MLIVVCPICHGSPAHAGIDLAEFSKDEYRRGFPRTRGDRPVADISRYPEIAVPPHTRG